MFKADKTRVTRSVGVVLHYLSAEILAAESTQRYHLANQKVASAGIKFELVAFHALRHVWTTIFYTRSLLDEPFLFQAILEEC